MNIDTDEDFPEHPKTVRFCAMLGNPIAWAYLWKLWRWCKKFQPDGDLTGFSPAEIELAVGWMAMDGRFFEAAVKAGFIDQDEAGTRIHNWGRRLGGSLLRMELDRVRKALAKATREGEATEVNRLKELDAALRVRLAAEGRRNSDGLPPESRRNPPPFPAMGAGTAEEFRRRADVSDLICSDLICADLARAGDPVPHPEPEPVALALAQKPPTEKSDAKRPTGYDLQRKFGEIRAEILGGLPWAAPPSAEGKAETFAARLAPADLAFVEPTMRRFCEHIAAGDDDWTDERFSKPAFAFGAWMSRFTEIREELTTTVAQKKAAQEAKWKALRFDPRAQPR